MARNRNERANLGEQVNQGMEANRAERTRGAGVHGDGTAGDEGIDDAMSRTHRDDMSATSNQGDELSESGSLDRSSSRSSTQREKSQRSQRTNKRSNDERFDNAREFSGQGNQKEGSEEAEGTGYTEESR